MKILKRRGFTLAEVLITLGVIGIVAALTIPNLIQKYQEQQYVNTFKSTYAIMYQAYIQAVQENGLPSTWELEAGNVESAKKAFGYFKPYLKNIKDLGTVSNVSEVERKGITRFVKRLGETASTTTAYTRSQLSNEYHFALPNGTVISFIPTSMSPLNTSLFMYWDLNGSKAPNQFGKDVFIVQLAEKKKAPVITGYGAGGWVPSQKYCSLTFDTGSGWYSGGSCATWVIKHWNMDYLHKSDEEIQAAW